MISNLQFENTYKFKVSFGVLLLLFPFVYSYLILSNEFGLFVGQDIVTTYPEGIRIAFERKMNTYAFFSHWCTLFVLYAGCIGTGVYFIIKGLYHWKYKETINEIIAHKNVEDSQEPIGCPKSIDGDEKATAVLTGQNIESENTRIKETTKRGNKQFLYDNQQLPPSFRHEGEIIEDACGELIRYQLGKNYDIYKNVRLSNEACVDIIAMPKVMRGGSDIIYEVKTGRGLVRFFERTIKTLAKNRDYYHSKTGRQCSVILLVVVEEKEIEQYSNKFKSHRILLQKNDVELEFVTQESLDKFYSLRNSFYMQKY